MLSLLQKPIKEAGIMLNIDGLESHVRIWGDCGIYRQ